MTLLPHCQISIPKDSPQALCTGLAAQSQHTGPGWGSTGLQGPFPARGELGGGNAGPPRPNLNTFGQEGAMPDTQGQIPVGTASAGPLQNNPGVWGPEGAVLGPSAQSRSTGQEGSSARPQKLCKAQSDPQTGFALLM